jgi:hypothetical protein
MSTQKTMINAATPLCGNQTTHQWFTPTNQRTSRPGYISAQPAYQRRPHQRRPSKQRTTAAVVIKMFNKDKRPAL